MTKMAIRKMEKTAAKERIIMIFQEEDIAPAVTGGLVPAVTGGLVPLVAAALNGEFIV